MCAFAVAAVSLPLDSFFNPRFLQIQCRAVAGAGAAVHNHNTFRFISPCSIYKASPKFLLLSQFRHNSYRFYNADSTFSSGGGGGGGGGDEDGDFDDSYDADSTLELDSISEAEAEDGIFIEIEKLDRNSRRIQSKIAIDASLDTIWNILTNYEGLADFIPGLAVSQLLEKRDNFARLYQIGQQDLAFGMKFNAKGIVDCYENDLKLLPSGQKRDIEFKMVEGDFQIFEGKWSIEQCNEGSCIGSGSSQGHNKRSTLSYLVNVKPKLWLPVHLIEGRLCREIKMNLKCIQREAQKANNNTLHAHECL